MLKKGLLSLIGLLIMACLAYAGVPKILSYQGVLTNSSGVPLEGTHSVTFSIYDVESGGTVLWGQTQNIQTEKGWFNVLLGSTTSLDLPFDRDYWLGIKVAGEVMAPRLRIASSAYAIMAGNTTALDGKDSSYYLNWNNLINVPAGFADNKDDTGAADTNWTEAGGNVYRVSGNVGIGTTSPGEKLTVAGTIESTSGGIKFPDGTTQTTATLKGDTGADGAKGDKGDTGTAGVKGDKGDTGSQGVAGTKGDTGSQGVAGNKGDTGSQGVAGTKGDTGPTLGIYDSLGLGSSGDRLSGDAGGRTLYNLGNVGIGTTSPSEQLEITGNLRLPTTTSTAGIIKVNTSRFIHNYGTNNTFVGLDAGNLTMTGSSNSAMGKNALYSNTTGNENTANGMSALHYNTTGYRNTANGVGALYYNTTGNNNTANGEGALFSNTTGINNTANGHLSLYSNKANSRSTAIGDGAMYYADNRTTGRETYNTAIGYEALRGSLIAGDNTGRHNTAIGDQALFSNTTGNYNIANGVNALYSNTTGYYNTANGQDALCSNTEGYQNTANGRNALFSNTTGNDNTANGYRALYSNTIGYRNTANGQDALRSNITGIGNTALGCNAFSGGASHSNSTALGYGAVITDSNQVRIGNNAVISIGGYQNWSNLSDGRFKKDVTEDVPGLKFIMKLRPVTFHWDMDKLDTFLDVPENLRLKEAEEQKSKILQTGFIAQEVEKSAAELGYDFSGIVKPANEKSHYNLSYAEFTVPLVKAVQELNAENEKLKMKNEELENKNEKLENEVKNLKAEYESRLKRLEEFIK